MEGGWNAVIVDGQSKLVNLPFQAQVRHRPNQAADGRLHHNSGLHFCPGVALPASVLRRGVEPPCSGPF